MSSGRYKSKKVGLLCLKKQMNRLKKCVLGEKMKKNMYMCLLQNPIKEKRDNCYLLTEGTKNPKAEIPFGTSTVPNPRLCVWQPTEDGLDGQCDTTGACIKEKLKELREA